MVAWSSLNFAPRENADETSVKVHQRAMLMQIALRRSLVLRVRIAPQPSMLTTLQCASSCPYTAPMTARTAAAGSAGQPNPPAASPRQIAAESVAIPARAARLLFRHLPQLVTIICLGLAGRQAVIWLAFWVSGFNTLAANLIMPLAPLSVMMSLIFALWALRPSLPFLTATIPDRTETSTRVRLLSAGGILVSFLTVYSTHGMLKEDIAAFRRAATYNEFFSSDPNFARAFVSGTGALVGLVVVTLMLRKVVGYFALAEKGLGFAYLASYLEVLWMTTASVVLTNRLKALQDWALSRKSIAPAYRRFEAFKTNVEGSFGPLGDAWNWLAEKLPTFNQLVTIPIAWLTLGAVVFGTSIAAKKVADTADAEAAGAPEGSEAATVEKTENARLRARRRIRDAAENEAHHVVEEALQPVAGPLKTIWNALRTLARAGLIPMTLFCLIFMLAPGVELGIVELCRWIIGPQHDEILAEVWGRYILIIARAAYLIVVVCLIASALDFFLRHSYEPDAAPSSELAPAPEGGGGLSKKFSDSGSTKVT